MPFALQEVMAMGFLLLALSIFLYSTVFFLWDKLPEARTELISQLSGALGWGLSTGVFIAFPTHPVGMVIMHTRHTSIQLGVLLLACVAMIRLVRKMYRGTNVGTVDRVTYFHAKSSLAVQTLFLAMGLVGVALSIMGNAILYVPMLLVAIRNSNI